MKSSKVKLHAEIPDPYFLADPSHIVEVVSKRIYYIINESKAQ